MPINATNSPWTDERIAELTKSWIDGQSAGLIAKAMDISRNSVIGKVRRLGLDSRLTVKGLVTRNFARMVRNFSGKSYPANRKRAAGIAPRIKAPAPVEPITATAVTLFDLTRHTCRWPLPGDPVTLFCGGAVEFGPYCPWHRRMAYSKRPRLTPAQHEAELRLRRRIYANLVRAA